MQHPVDVDDLVGDGDVLGEIIQRPEGQDSEDLPGFRHLGRDSADRSVAATRDDHIGCGRRLLCEVFNIGAALREVDVRTQTVSDEAIAKAPRRLFTQHASRACVDNDLDRQSHASIIANNLRASSRRRSFRPGI